MAGENTTINVTYKNGDADVSYELTPGENSALDKSDLEKVAAYATEKKLTAEQAKEFVSHREEAASGVRSRFEAANKAPEKYDLKLKEGTVLDQSDLDAIATFAKANKLTQAQAELLVRQREEVVVADTAANKTFLETQKAKWLTDTKADPEIGGAKLTDTLKNTKRVMDRFAPEGSDFRKMLDETGYGNHPYFLKFVNAIGKAMREDGDVGGGGGGGGNTKTLAEKMYPSMAK